MCACETSFFGMTQWDGVVSSGAGACNSFSGSLFICVCRCVDVCGKELHDIHREDRKGVPLSDCGRFAAEGSLPW